MNHLNNCSPHNSKDPPPPRGLNDKGANMDLFSQSSRYQSVTHGYTRLRFPVLRNTGGYHIGCIMCASAVAECMLPGSTFSSMHTCIRLQKTNTECPKTVVKKKKKKGGSLDFYLLKAKWLFFRPNTIIITHGRRGCTFDAALAGGTEIKSEEMTVGIKAAIDKEADAAC